jgi:hypothetical protein
VIGVIEVNVDDVVDTAGDVVVDGTLGAPDVGSFIPAVGVNLARMVARFLMSSGTRLSSAGNWP